MLSSSSFGKRTRLSRLALLSKHRPPPLKSCLAASEFDRNSTPSGEPCVRKTVHFPDDKLSLERVKIIPARPERNQKTIFKKGQVAETKSFIMYTSNPSGTNQRFLSKLPGSSGPRYETHSQWMSVVRARGLAAAYSSVPRSPRSAPSSEGPAPEPATDGSRQESSFDMSSLKDALPEPASSSSPHGSDFDMSSTTRALPDPETTFDVSSLADALPDPNDSFDMSSLMRALPDLDAPSEVSSPAPAPQCLVAPPSCEAPHPPKVRRRVVQTRIRVGPFSPAWFFNLSAVFLVVGSCFPCLAPAFYAVLVFLFINGMCFFCVRCPLSPPRQLWLPLSSFSCFVLFCSAEAFAVCFCENKTPPKKLLHVVGVSGVFWCFLVLHLGIW
ncbi:unnamed protein product [Penicillium egyptiacum]|uniref:Uncharacterized protein n=1 Tax=Penicillium egyptiacum TaxID=1303716 RepID=A0A9W4KPX2_9EURO|nr:unnamed protein product [Penicillium egyptiacum]